MHCSMCYSSEGKLQMFHGDMDNDTFKRIVFVLPDFSIPETQDPVFICDTCLEQVSLFYTNKKASLENCFRLKYFHTMLKGTNNFKCEEILVIINSDKVASRRIQNIQFEVNLNSKYLLTSEEQNTHIKKEDNKYRYSDTASLNSLQDEESSNSSNDSTQHKNKLVDTFSKKGSNLRSNNSRHEDQQKTQREIQKEKFKCTDCHKAFTYRSSLEQHTRVHTGDKPYKCTTCQKTFKQSSNLNSHKRTHTGEKPHKCDVCNKTFNQKSDLIIHKRIHNNVRPFQCAVCSKRFTTSGNLTVHMLTHTGEKPHQCHLCEYKCITADSLKVHIRSHTGEKPYSCKHCEKSFTTSSNLKKHKRRLHSDEDSD